MSNQNKILEKKTVSGIGYYLIPLIVFTLVFVIRYIVAGLYTVNMPYFEEWTTQLGTLMAYQNNELSLQLLFTPNEENITFLPRLFWILIYSIKGSWDLIFISQCRTIFIGITAALFSYYIIKDTKRIQYISHLFIICVFICPFDYENVTSCIQVQYYIVFLLSVVFLRILSKEKEISFSKVILLFIILAGAFFSLAVSALLALIAGLAFLYYWLKSSPTNRKFFYLAALMLFSFCIMYALIPKIPCHGGHLWINFELGVIKFIWLFVHFIFIKYPRYIFVFLPFLIFVAYHLVKRKMPASRYNFMMLLYVFYILIYFACVYNRGYIASRHKYFLISSAMGLLLLIDLMPEGFKLKKILNLLKIFIIVGSFFCFYYCLGQLDTVSYVGKSTRKLMALAIRKSIDIERVDGEDACTSFFVKCQAYLKPPGIPYPTAEGLTSLVTTPLVLEFLPKRLSNNPLSKPEHEELMSYFPVINKINITDIKTNANLIHSCDLYDEKRLEGSAYIPGQDIKKTSIFIILSDNLDKTFQISNFFLEKSDTGVYRDILGKYGESGFKCDLSTLDLPEGRYRIGILIKNGEYIAFSWLDKYYTRMETVFEKD